MAEQPCPDCGGRGHEQEDCLGPYICPTCDGTGKAPPQPPLDGFRLTALVKGPPGRIEQVEGDLEVEIVIRRKGEKDTKRITFDAEKVQYDPSAFVLRALPTSIINVDTHLGVAVIKMEEPKHGPD